MEAVKTDLMAERYYEAHDRLVKALDYIKAAMNEVRELYDMETCLEALDEATEPLFDYERDYRDALDEWEWNEAREEDAFLQRQFNADRAEDVRRNWR